MNSLGIELFINNVNIGDAISIRCTKYGDMTYEGIVQQITDATVLVKSTMQLDLFETLAIPSLEEFEYEDIWWYSTGLLSS